MGKAKVKKKTYLSEKEFWRIVRANGGLFARTAKAIESEFKMTYTRHAVRDRANKKPELLADIEDENGDIAEGVLFDLLESEDERIKADIAKFYLKTKGKNRGYVEKQEIEHSGTVETSVILPKLDDSEG